ncbi:hypothetical protein BJ138DRAFT_1223452 [Hygrophoropsis aurantiaca]|uniref:Uncharacterized protein n=1 Tax=Hygrophoropsis aurantiaca TaxID=72124 RepID=A0ACB7ZZ38_9AGAM|nr:hypothetical protein BJ138DRAFT_1223452 [Hygrophoropsis aurantiaca]
MSPCICGTPWSQHAPLGETLQSIAGGTPSSASTGNLSPADTSTVPYVVAQSSAFSPRPLSMEIMPSAARPISAFSVPSPVPGNTATRRAVSAVHHRSRHPFPSSSTSTVTTTVSSPKKLCILFFPHGLDTTGNQSEFIVPTVRMVNNDIPELIDRFTAHNLFFTVTISPTGSVWKEIDLQLREHFHNHHIVLEEHPHRSDVFHHAPWVFLTPGRRVNHKYTINQDPLMNVNRCTAPIIEAMGKKTPNPCEGLSDQPLVFMTSRYGPLKAPIELFIDGTSQAHNHHLPHACWADHVCCDLLPAFLSIPECYPTLCPAPPTLPSNGTLTQHNTYSHNLVPCVRSRPTSPELLQSDTNSNERRPTRRVRYGMHPSTRPPRIQGIQAEASAETEARATASESYLRSLSGNVSPSWEENEASTLSSFSEDVGDPTYSGPGMPQSHSSSDVAPTPALVPGVDIAHDREIRVWMRHAEAFVPLEAITGCREISIHGHTIEAIADCVLKLVMHVIGPAGAGGSTFVAPAEILSCTFRGVKTFSFFQGIRNYQVGVRHNNAPVSLGSGIERGVFRTIMSELIPNMHLYWEHRGSYYTPILSIACRPIPERLLHFKAFGFLSACHFLLYGAGPTPLSPFLWIAIILGPDCIPFKLPFIAALEPSLAASLQTWMSLSADDPLPTRDPLSPLSQFLISYLNLQPSMISQTRTTTEHDSWTQTFQAKCLLGHEDPWNHPEFLALKEGFDMALSPDSDDLTFIKAFKDAFGASYVPALVAAMYSREIKSPTMMLEHLDYEVAHNANDNTTGHWTHLFQIAMTSYLMQPGHPERAMTLGLVSADAFEKDKTDQALRSRLLLQSATGSNLMPVNLEWKITFSIIGENNGKRRELNTQDQRSAALAGAPFKFHTCYAGVEVTIDQYMETLLTPTHGDTNPDFDLFLEI